MSAASLIVFLVVALAISCRSASPTLELRTGSITEEGFRIQVRQIAFLQPGIFDITCEVFVGSSVDASSTARVLEAFQKANPFVTVVRPLEFHSADAARAVEIIAEECESLT